MHLPTIAAAFAAVFVAELPDKTMLATIVLSARFRRPFAVWLGAGAALTLQMVIAVTAGRLLGLLPDRPVGFAVAGLFAIGAVVLWRGSYHDDDPNDEIADDVRRERGAQAGLAWRRVSATSFGIVFIAEWGDLTQLATASLASTRPAISVLIGAAAAMICVSFIGAMAGRGLLRIIPERVLQRVAAIIFATLAVVFFVTAIREVDIDTGVNVEAVSYSR